MQRLIAKYKKSVDSKNRSMYNELENYIINILIQRGGGTGPYETRQPSKARAECETKVPIPTHSVYA